MNTLDLNEAVNLLNGTILSSLLALIRGQSGTVGAQLNYQCGLLTANAFTELNATPDGDYAFWINLAKCFDAAQQMGVTYQQMDTVRTAAEASTPKGLPAIAVRNFSVRMALAEQARILAATTFTSRQVIDDYFDQINASFDTAETEAANNLDNVAYVALVQLHAAVSNDLANRARPLPRMVTYTYNASKPALYMAQNLYQDPVRYEDLISENSPIHPLFMPASGRALSS